MPDIELGTLDIHNFQLPASSKLVNGALTLALVVYIITTFVKMYWKRNERREQPLLRGEEIL